MRFILNIYIYTKSNSTKEILFGINYADITIKVCKYYKYILFNIILIHPAKTIHAQKG